MKLGIIRETKVPADKRVPLTPAQCHSLLQQYPELQITVESSDIRCYKDKEYQDYGITISTDLKDCDVLLGVKEINPDHIIPNKTYLFFSHTIKEQPYNKSLLQIILKNNVKLIDYEVLRAKNGNRLIGFGRYAGIVGCYNGFLAYGLKSGEYNLKPAHQCHDRKELEQELKKIKLPTNYKIVMTGNGRVGKGALEILDAIGIQMVTSQDFLTKEFNHPVFAKLSAGEYRARKDGQAFDLNKFFECPQDHVSLVPMFTKTADMYVACHYWDSRGAKMFTWDDIKSDNFKTTVIADISCDIAGPIPTTIRPSTIEAPLYGIDPITEKECDYKKDGAICVMAVDNLPCELPRDASEDFGTELTNRIIPCLMGNDPDKTIDRASIAVNGKLGVHFEHLSDYVKV